MSHETRTGERGQPVSMPELPSLEPISADRETIEHLEVCIAAIGSPVHPATQTGRVAPAWSRVGAPVVGFLIAATALTVAPFLPHGIARHAAPPHRVARPFAGDRVLGPAGSAPAGSRAEVRADAPPHVVGIDPVLIVATPRASEKPEARPPGTSTGTSTNAANATQRAVAAPATGASASAEFDPAAARAAIAGARVGTEACGPDAVGRIRITVTFAPSGRATRALVDEGLQGTDAGGCVAHLLNRLTVPPFGGEPQTVRMHLVLR
jgi:hypothetical protein